MERHRRGKGKQKLLGSHARCWIWGRNAVLETLKAGRWPYLDLYLSDTLPAADIDQATRLAGRLGPAPCVEAPEQLTRLAHTSEHQGYLARMTEFPYVSEQEALDSLPTAPFCAILDRVQDPFNLGAIVRSAEVFGVDAVFLGASGQVGVTSMVVRSSAGAVNRVPIVRVPSVEEIVDHLAVRGVRVVAASEKAQPTLAEQAFREGTAILVGNEGYGVDPRLLAKCAACVRIPQSGQIGSLNAAVAASIFFYEVRRQRGSAC